MSKREVFFTTDFTVATVLRMLNVELVRIERRSPTKAAFVFDNQNSQAQKISMDLFKGKYSFEPTRLFAEYQNVRSMLFSALSEAKKEVPNE